MFGGEHIGHSSQTAWRCPEPQFRRHFIPRVFPLRDSTGEQETHRYPGADTVHSVGWQGARLCGTDRMRLFVRIRIHCGMGRFCLRRLASVFLVRKVLFAGCDEEQRR
eukprot:scaffold93999_cov39-Tisochrysis_lutea.AAC.1